MSEIAVETVRCPFQDQDARELQAFLVPLIASLDPPFTEDVETEVEQAIDLLARHPGGAAIVARDKAEIVGVLIGYVNRFGVGFVRWVAVALTHRQLGIGNRLVAAFEQQEDVQRLEGMVNTDDHVALGFWRSQGWVVRGDPARTVLLMGSEVHDE